MSSLRSARREASAARASSSRIARADWLPLFTPLLLPLGVVGVVCMVVERWRAAVGVRIAVDCARPAQARLEQVTYGEEGAMISDSWEQMATDDPLIVAACG